MLVVYDDNERGKSTLNGEDLFCSFKGVVVDGGPFNINGKSVTGEFDGAVTRIWEL